MNALRKSAPANAPMRTALIVTANPGHARIDRISLMNARIAALRAVSSAKAARTHLSKVGADVVLVDETLADATGWDFMLQLKADPLLRHIPVILLSARVERSRLLEAIRLGCVGFLLRPYSMDAFFTHLSLARQTQYSMSPEHEDIVRSMEMAGQGQAQQAAAELEKAAESAGDAQHHYECGMRLLAQQEYTQAVESFTRAARLSALMAEAHLGLARCWLALGDEVRYRKALTQAADICAKAKRFEHYKDAFLSVLQEDPRGFNPFVSLGLRLRREMDLDGALMALKNAVWLSPDDAAAHLELARVWHFKREPELARQSVDKALSLSPHDAQAQDLYARWTGRNWGEDEEAADMAFSQESRQAIPDVLPAMLNGVLYLAGVVTEGIHRFRRGYA